MSELILHHYPVSPFAEKARLMLGFKGLDWRSVKIPEILPKPDVVALTGGYRRTPFLQIGADIYCDTALIAEVLERVAPDPAPPLFPAGLGPAARIYAQWADATLFWTAMPYSFQPQGLAFIFAGVPEEVAKAFGEDRAAMRGNAPRLNPRDAHAMLAQQISWIDSWLADGREFIGREPSIADFAVYHPLWFVRRIEPLAGILPPRVLQWMDRVAAFGHGKSTKLSSAEAIEIARSATPAPLQGEWFDTHGLEAGAQVTVTPTDYALDAVAGELLMASASEIAIRRVDERAGEVVVHFPRHGYALKKA